MRKNDIKQVSENQISKSDNRFKSSRKKFEYCSVSTTGEVEACLSASTFFMPLIKSHTYHPKRKFALP
jgi:hypothetical protein